MHRHIIYIINPISGARTKKDLRAIIEQKTKEEDIPFQIFPSVVNADYSFLHSLIREQGTTDIVIAGGDGTVGQVVGSLYGFDLRFGIIPCGSGNGLAFTAKIPRQAEKALDIIFSGHSLPVDAFTINGHFAVHLCGLGFDAKVAHDFAKQPRRGLATYVRQIVKNFFSAQKYSFEVQLPDHSFAADAYFISIANSNQFGNNFTIAPKASLHDGLLDIVILTDRGRMSLLLQTLRQVRGRNPLQSGTISTGRKGIIYFQAEKLTIINRSLAPLHIDGDPAETSEIFDFAVMKNCFRLLQPGNEKMNM